MSCVIGPARICPSPLSNGEGRSGQDDGYSTNTMTLQAELNEVEAGGTDWSRYCFYFRDALIRSFGADHQSRSQETVSTNYKNILRIQASGFFATCFCFKY